MAKSAFAVLIGMLARRADQRAVRRALCRGDARHHECLYAARVARTLSSAPFGERLTAGSRLFSHVYPRGPGHFGMN
jgi:hypothetical protein